MRALSKNGRKQSNTRYLYTNDAPVVSYIPDDPPKFHENNMPQSKSFNKTLKYRHDGLSKSQAPRLLVLVALLLKASVHKRPPYTSHIPPTHILLHVILKSPLESVQTKKKHQPSKHIKHINQAFSPGWSTSVIDAGIEFPKGVALCSGARWNGHLPIRDPMHNAEGWQKGHNTLILWPHLFFNPNSVYLIYLILTYLFTSVRHAGTAARGAESVVYSCSRWNRLLRMADTCWDKTQKPHFPLVCEYNSIWKQNLWLPIDNALANQKR